MPTALELLEALPCIDDSVRLCAKDLVYRLEGVGLVPAVHRDGSDVELRLAALQTTLVVGLVEGGVVLISVYANSVHPDTAINLAAVLAAQAGGN